MSGLPSAKTYFEYMQTMRLLDASQSIFKKCALPLKQMGRNER